MKREKKNIERIIYEIMHVLYVHYTQNMQKKNPFRRVNDKTTYTFQSLINV